MEDDQASLEEAFKGLFLEGLVKEVDSRNVDFILAACTGYGVSPYQIPYKC